MADRLGDTVAFVESSEGAGFGNRDVPSRISAEASAVLARNLYNFLAAFWDKDAGRPVLAEGDEIGEAIRLTTGGKMVSPRLTS